MANTDRDFLASLLVLVGGKLRSPLGVIGGSPREVATLLAELPDRECTAYQMDLYQARRVEENLSERNLSARVVTAADLWDLPERFATLLYPVPDKGERGLKLDMVEQAFHVLAHEGTLVVLSPYEKDLFFPEALKKVFGRVHAPLEAKGHLVWCTRHGERPRRRHEITFQVRGDNESLRFLSRPGVFAYGRFDEGARALVDVMEIEPGDRVLDLGCGCGVIGAFAGKRSGPSGFTTFADSNVRAVALAEHNARALGLTNFETRACREVEGLAPASFDVVLTNPPYYAHQTIAQRFVGQAHSLLKPGGRFYLVTKQLEQIEPWVTERFADVRVLEHRSYAIFHATKEQDRTP